MNRARALLICTRPQDYEPTRVSEAAAYLSGRSDATEDEQRLASEAVEWLRSKRDEPLQATVEQREPTQAGKRKRKR